MGFHPHSASVIGLDAPKIRSVVAAKRETNNRRKIVGRLCKGGLGCSCISRVRRDGYKVLFPIGAPNVTIIGHTRHNRDEEMAAL